MGLDHSLAFVRLTFDGLIGFCIPQRGARVCEMGMVPADDHDPLLTIIRIDSNGNETDVRRDFRLVRNENVRIEAVSPVTAGASMFTAAGFNAVSDTGDPEDFRWAMNLQDGRFHGQNLRLNRGAGATLLRPKIIIPHGVFYTKDKTSIPFGRFRPPSHSPRVPIGKVADTVGVDIACNFVAGQKTVNVTIGSSAPIPLEFQTSRGLGFTYAIRITNLCRRSGGGPNCQPSTSDFPQYYRVATDSGGVQFDLDPLYPPGDPRGTTPIDEFDRDASSPFKGFRSNGPPEICAMSFFGEENDIP